MQWEIAFHPMLSGHVQHPCDLAEDGFMAVPVFSTFHHDDPIGFVDCEVEPSELFGAGAAELNHVFAVRGIPGGLKEFEESLLFPFPPLHTPFGMIPLEMRLQIVGLHESGLAVLSRACVGADVVMDHCVSSQIYLNPERHTTARDIALERPLIGVGSCVVHQVVLL
jgi:hypothetical protein